MKQEPLIFSVINQKGGVGKTTTVHNLVDFLGRKKYKCLAIDMDPQASLTIGTGVDPDEDKNIVYMLNNPDDSVIRKIEYFDLLPGSIMLSEFDVSFSAKMGREGKVKEFIDGIKHNYDFIFLDCAPTLGLATINALVASDFVLIPQQTEFFSMKGLSLILDSINMVKENELNDNLEVFGILLTMFDVRKNLHKDVKDVIRENFPDKTFETIIRSNVDLATAPSHYRSIFEYADSSKGAIDYKKFGQEFLRRIKQLKGAKS